MRFRLLTYNIHKAIGTDRRFDPARIIAVIEHHDADIVLLQEVDRHVPRSHHLDLAAYLARELKYDYRAVGINVHLKKGKYGNATLSRFLIGRQRNIDLTVGARKRRGAQHTRVSLSGPAAPSVDVFNVHLGLAGGERRIQVHRLLTTDDVAHLDENQPCIIAGDMNDWRGVLRRQFMAPVGFHCATNVGPAKLWALKTFPSYAPTGGLDKIFYRGPLKLLHVQRSRLKVARVASDHLPIIAEFELVQPRQPQAHHPPAYVTAPVPP